MEQEDGMRWSIRRAIELLDEAIDAMGAQLARSADLMADEPSARHEPTRRTRSPTGRREPISTQPSAIDPDSPEYLRTP